MRNDSMPKGQKQWAVPIKRHSLQAPDEPRYSISFRKKQANYVWQLGRLVMMRSVRFALRSHTRMFP